MLSSIINIFGGTSETKEEVKVAENVFHPEEMKSAKAVGFDLGTKQFSEGSWITSVRWVDLSAGQQVDLKNLGWDQVNWDGEYGVIWDNFWNKLTEEQLAAATAVGYDEKTWNHENGNPLEHKHWSELSEEEKKHLDVLGYTQEIWDREHNDEEEDDEEEDEEEEKEDLILTAASRFDIILIDDLY